MEKSMKGHFECRKTNRIYKNYTTENVCKSFITFKYKLNTKMNIKTDKENLHID